MQKRNRTDDAKALKQRRNNDLIAFFYELRRMNPQELLSVTYEDVAYRFYVTKQTVEKLIARDGKKFIGA
jgi:hypothetical protein